METKLAPFALPCARITHDGYPNLTIFEIDQVPVKDIEWFLNLIGQSVWVASYEAESGRIAIEDEIQAGKLFATQVYGYKYLTLPDRLKQAQGSTYPALVHQEPVESKLYTLTIYLNGELQEQKTVRYVGLTDNMKWYCFEYQDGPDQQGNQHHLLTVGHFPNYMKRINPDVVCFEKYTIITHY